MICVLEDLGYRFLFFCFIYFLYLIASIIMYGLPPLIFLELSTLLLFNCFNSSIVNSFLIKCSKKRIKYLYLFIFYNISAIYLFSHIFMYWFLLYLISDYLWFIVYTVVFIYIKVLVIYYLKYLKYMLYNVVYHEFINTKCNMLVYIIIMWWVYPKSSY